MREKRLRQRLALVECAKRTHISVPYLEALEEERWERLPSESHRLGFLRLYARFLGEPAEDIVALYHHGRAASSPTVPSKTAEQPAPEHPRSGKRRLIEIAWPQVGWVLLGVLLASWVAYHFLGFRAKDSGNQGWVPFRARRAGPAAPRREAVVHRIGIKAQADSWVRVVENKRLLFEGILPAGFSKGWTGSGPFHLRIANIQAVQVTWNDQPVDTRQGARGNMNDIQLPPSSVNPQP